MSSAREKAWFVARLLLIFGLPIACLFVANIVLASFRDNVPRWLWLVGGLVFALAFLTGTSALMQRLTGFFRRKRLLPLGFAAAFVVGTSLVVQSMTGVQSAWDFVRSGGDIEGTEPVHSALDVLLVQPPQWAFDVANSVPDYGDTPDEARRWNVRFSVASPTLETFSRLRFRLIGGQRNDALEALFTSQGPLRPEDKLLASSLASWAGWRVNAARATVLNVDGIHSSVVDAGSTATRPADWEAMLGNDVLRPPVYVILGETSDARLKEWQEWAASKGGEAVRFGETGRALLVDAALRIATERSGEFAYETLAWRHRPKLLFDTREKLRNPLDIDRFLASDKVAVCGRIGWRGKLCTEINDPRLGAARDAFVSFDFRKIRPNAMVGAIYYHVVRRGTTLYLDYWWYFPYNPTAVGRNALCGPGFTAPGLTCFDHESDWEGITLVLRKRGLDFIPRKIIYAQHEHGVAYDWDAVTGAWRRAGLLEDDRHASHARPVVFVAKDSHASYPVGCSGGCRQIHRPKVRGEGDYDGRKAWTRNGDDCAVCLKRLPQTRDGRPALWNASPLAWGKPSCLLRTAICDVGAAPKSPRFQGRFTAPWKPLAGTRKEFRGFRVRYSKYD